MCKLWWLWVLLRTHFYPESHGSISVCSVAQGRFAAQCALLPLVCFLLVCDQLLRVSNCRELVIRFWEAESWYSALQRVSVSTVSQQVLHLPLHSSYCTELPQPHGVGLKWCCGSGATLALNLCPSCLSFSCSWDYSPVPPGLAESPLSNCETWASLRLCTLFALPIPTGMIRTPVSAAYSEGLMHKYVASFGQSLAFSIGNHIKFGRFFCFFET